MPSPAGGELTLYSATQIPHILKVMTAVVLGIPENKLRVVAPSVGGRLRLQAQCLRRGDPLQRVGHGPGRAGALDRGSHRGGHLYHPGPRPGPAHRAGRRRRRQGAGRAGEAAGRHGRLPAAGHAGRAAAGRVPVPRLLRHPELPVRVHVGVHQPHADRRPTGARGRPEATYAVERAMDSLAAAVGVSPEEIRARNFIGADAFPYESSAGLVFDSGDYQAVLDKAVSLAGLDERRAEQAQRLADGSSKRIGIGFSSYVEMCGLAPSRVLASLAYGAGGWEAATVRISPTCKVQVVTGSTPHGQGHETCWSMIVADKLGVDPDDVEVLHSDTRREPHRPGHLRVPVAGSGRHRGVHGHREGDRQGPGHCRPTSWRPRRTTWSSPAARSGCGARPRPRCRWRGSPSRRSPPMTCPTGWSPTWRPTSPTTRPTSRSPTAPTSRWWRWTPTPATWTWWTTWRWTTAACRSTR